MRMRTLKAELSALVVNYQTPDLLEAAVRSFNRAYPDVQVLIIDNGSQDDSPERIAALQRELGPAIEALFLTENTFHGPAMHRGMEQLQTPFVYVFDSDTETRQPGFLEPMLALLSGSEQDYGAGHRVTVNRRGFAAPQGIPVLASAYMLLKRDLYHRLPPFIHHGLPALQNFKAAQELGYRLHSFPIERYVAHFGRGTAARYGYGLGLRSRLDYVLNKLGL